MDDAAVPPLAFKVAAALARYADARTGEVDRSQSFLAQKVNVKVRALQLAIDLLVERGHVVVIKPKGRKLGNRYRLVLRSKPDPNPVNAHGDAHETEPVNAHVDAHENGFHVQLNARSCAPRCALYPVYDPRESSSRPAQSAEMTTIESALGLTDGEMLDRLRRGAPGKIGDTKAISDLRLLRELIAEGIPFEAVIVPAVVETVAGLRRPLGSWAKFVLDAIRARAVAEGYGPGAATTSPASMTADAGPTVALPGSDTVWPAAEVQRWAARWNDRRSWPEQALGEPPDRQDARRSPDFQAALDAGHAEIVAAVASWQHDPASWKAQRLGPPPDSLSSRLALAPEFVDGVRLRSGLVVTVAALHRALDAGQLDEDVFGGPPSRANNPASALSPEWQIEALEYRAGRV